MKKLFSLLIVALISSQMWGTAVKIYVNKTNKTTTTTLCGGGTVKAGYTTTANKHYANQYTVTTYNTSITRNNGEKVDATATNTVSGWEFDHWVIVEGTNDITNTTSKVTINGNSVEVKIASTTIYIHAIYVQNVTYVTATFNNYNGTQLYQNTSVVSGTTPTYGGSTPTKPSTANNVYTFTGWSPALGNITTSTTYTAQFRTDAVATFRNYNNTATLQSVQVASGSTPSYTNATPTKPSTAQYQYAFTGWNTALDGSGNALGNISVNTTFYPQFSQSTRTYTIRFFMEAGDETPIQTLQVAYNETPVCTASVTKTADTYWTYEFYGWDGNNDGVADGVSAVTGDKDYVAVFTKTSTGVIPPHNLTIGAATNGYVTLTPNTNSITVTVPAAGETYQYPEGTDIIVEAVPARGYHFSQWSDASTAKRRLISEIENDWSLTPTFAANTPFDMLDTWTQAQCGTEYDFEHVLTVTLVGRTFTAGQWATLSVPFDYTLAADDALYNTIYKFTNVTLSSGGSSVYLEFVRTNDIEKNEPYLVVPRQAGINEVVFDGVKLETPAAISLTTDDRVAFVSSLWQQEISGPNDFYIGKLSTLYYAPNSGMTIKGNRAFFRKIGDAASAPAPRRAIVVIDGEEREVEIADGNIEEVQNVRKYMENGILIIERNGVRYNAQGQVAE